MGRSSIIGVNEYQRYVCSIVPPLDFNLHKGQCGRIAVIGGSDIYTGERPSSFSGKPDAPRETPLNSDESLDFQGPLITSECLLSGWVPIWFTL